MSWAIFIFAGIGCMSIGATIGFCLGNAFVAAKAADEQMNRFLS
jgi:hypothetical protein